MNDDDEITTIRVTKRNLYQLRIIKAIERKNTYNDIIRHLMNKYYDNYKHYNDFFEQKT